MQGLDRLKVSLTKQGYFKVAEVIIRHPRNEVLENIRGAYPNINLDRVQIANMLSADRNTNELPEIWDDIRQYGDTAVQALTFIAIIFSHRDFIETLAKSRIAEMRGILKREDLGDKTYNNFCDAMQRFHAAVVRRGSQTTPYNLSPIFEDMTIGPLVKQLLILKLEQTGWRSPADDDPFTRNFYEQCFYYGFQNTLAISEQQFEDWLEGRAVMVEKPPVVIVPDTTIKVSASLVAALAAKPFVIISGPTGTGKTATVRQLALALKPLLDKGQDSTFNHVFIPVEAGWTDGRHLVGYRNPFGKMGESYHSTPLIRLLLRANYAEYSAIPFFVVLDEMNLSYVEMYFSRFLSLMETINDQSPEPVLGLEELELMRRSGVSDAVELSYIGEAIDKGGLYLTQNVFIVGTVNVDETTHTFSPKVLDRAFVLQFPTLRPSEKPVQFEIPDYDLAEGEVKAIAKYLVESSQIQPSTAYDAFLDEIYDTLGKFQFGPRVTMEAQRYIQCIFELVEIAKCHDSFSQEVGIKDHIIMQKILPKIHGNRSQLRSILENLSTYAKTKALKSSILKLESMTTELQSPGFTNFFA